MDTKLSPPQIASDAAGIKWGHMGDSIANGSSASAGQRYAGVLPMLTGSLTVFPVAPAASASLAQPWSATKGNAGETSAAMLARFDADIIAPGFKACTLLCGTNDAAQGVSLATYSANVKAMVAKSRAAGIPIVIGTTPPRGSGAVAGGANANVHVLIRAYNAWLQAWCRQAGVPLASVYAGLVDTTTGYLAATYDSGDNTHPNTAGHLIIAQRFASAITTALGQGLGLITTAGGGLNANPLMVGAGTQPTGYFEQPGGSGTAPTYSIVNDTTGRLRAGRWAQMDFDATASGGTRRLARALATTGFAAGDVMALCAQVDGDDVSGYAAATAAGTGAWSLTVLNQSAVTIAGASLPSANPQTLTPGPLVLPFAMPSGVTGPLLWFNCTLPTGAHAKFRLGCADVLNLTTLGLNNLAALL